ncbi:mannose-1-phosphate guanylyltransferase/mannose-6-phosphate isomerase [Prochlorococcus marinus]
MKKIIPIILCGGSGSRLWPLSRASFPKQFLEINKEEPISFFQRTISRFKNYESIGDPIVICNEEHRFIVAEQLRKINIKPEAILLEPVGKNTAPAITVGCLKAIENHLDPCLLVLPSDHIIEDINTFIKVIDKALDEVKRGKVITFGITPTKPETGYGYIESEKELDTNKLKGEKIVNFIEKPDLELAKKLFCDKRYTWNSGIFFFKAEVFLKEIIKYKANIYKICKESLLNNTLDLDFQRIEVNSFSLCEDISVDKAIMEKTNLGVVYPLKCGWNDIGSWQSMWEISHKDELGNSIIGKVITDNVKNSYFRSENRLIVALGIEETVVVETIDAVLIAKKDQIQFVKNIVKKLEIDKNPEANIHKTIYRPWGNYSSISEGKNWQVKKIIVKEGESLSLQLHNHRSEHWVVVSGKALIEIEGKKKLLNKNESAYIPLGSKHRLSNPGNSPLILIEVQSGDYFGEDDIIRFQDKYGR